jgi:hypothetical protein
MVSLLEDLARTRSACPIESQDMERWPGELEDRMMVS